MSRIENIEDIDGITVHWSESPLINDELGCDENGDIEKLVSPHELDGMVMRAVSHVTGGYDKTSLTVKLKGGRVWADKCKFYLGRNEAGLLSLLNKGE